MLLADITILLALLALLPVTVFFAQVLIGFPVYGKQAVSSGSRAKIAVLIPAHNESAGIAKTLASIQPQLLAGDRLIVIADNCSDDTAQISRGLGAEVVERMDQTKRGKGYALDYGIRHLATGVPPEMVLFIDADCLIDKNTIDYLALTCQKTARPAQALYLMFAPRDAGMKMRFAQFAWAVKNRLRAMAFYRLGLPCGLTGSGMIFPWRIISQAQLANNQIVEDLKMGIDLACLGSAPVLCPEALVTSSFPSNEAGVKTQRTRWEHGHLSLILSECPRLISAAFQRKEPKLVCMALDLCVPPLSFLVLSIFGLLFLTGLEFLMLGIILPLTISISGLVLMCLAILVAWWAEGRQLISVYELLYSPIYAARKIPLYISFFVNRQVEWIRSSRDKK
ncbi:MAG: glycosyltransferase family 2 protein [Methylomonas sp.]